MILEESEMSAKRRLPLVPFANADEIERVFEAKYCKVLATVDAIEKVGREREADNGFSS